MKLVVALATATDFYELDQRVVAKAVESAAACDSFTDEFWFGSMAKLDPRQFNLHELWIEEVSRRIRQVCEAKKVEEANVMLALWAGSRLGLEDDWFIDFAKARLKLLLERDMLTLCFPIPRHNPHSTPIVMNTVFYQYPQSEDGQSYLASEAYILISIVGDLKDPAEDALLEAIARRLLDGRATFYKEVFSGTGHFGVRLQLSVEARFRGIESPIFQIPTRKMSLMS